MKTSYMPEGVNHVMPYLIINNALGFIAFVKDVFDAEERTPRHMRDENTVMHAEVKIGDSVIMLADATPEYPTMPAGMFIYVPDADAAYNRALAAGGVSALEMCDQPYGRTGGVKDPFGNTWWITTDSRTAR